MPERRRIDPRPTVQVITELLTPKTPTIKKGTPLTKVQTLLKKLQKRNK